MFEAYLGERAQEHHGLDGIARYLALSLVVTVGGLVHAHIGMRLSTERVIAPPPRSSRVVSSIEWPQDSPAIICGLDDEGPDDGAESVSALGPPRVRGQERAGRRPRLDPEPPVCLGLDPPLDPLGLLGAMRSPPPNSIGRPLTSLSEPSEPQRYWPLRQLHSPAPSVRALAQTFTGRRDRHPGSVEVGVCVDPRGQVVQAHVEKGFAHDREVDRLALAAAKRWRFRPMLVGGSWRPSCTTIRFEIDFTPRRP